jgi:response regulator NasT
VALGRFAEMQALEAENAALADDKRSLEEQLETRRWVDRAKGKLMDDHSMAESQAFSFIQQTAMNGRTTMREIAKGVVDGSITP